MAPKNSGPSLSAGFLKHLGVEAKDSQGRKKYTGVQNRKDQRKEARSKPQPNRQPNRPQKHRPVQAKQQPAKSAGAPANGPVKGKSAPMRVINPEDEDDSLDSDDFDDDIDMDDMDDDEDEDDEDDMGDEDDDMEGDDDEDAFDEDEDEDEDEDDNSDDDKQKPSAATPKVSGRMRERLEQDDAEIAELERKLGMKGRKNLPQSFKDDGLGDILESLGGGGGEESVEVVKKSKRKAEADEWLQAKRQKALGLEQQMKKAKQQDEGSEGDDEDNEDDDEDGGMEDDDMEDDDDFGGFDDTDDENGESDKDAAPRKSKKDEPKRQRENPYVAPVSASAPQKYVPPALRRAMAHGTDSESEAVSRVRRQAHHLIARLSDANMLTILSEVEKLYTENPRQYVTDAVTDKLLEQIQIDGALSSNVTVLIAGFATAVYMVKGTDFGAHFIQQNATAFKQHYDALLKAEAEQAARDPEHLNAWAPTSKIAINLFSLMAELYNFRMIGPNLIYDYIRMLLSSLTETNTELLLRVFETSGTRLRQDDPRSLKDIVSLVQPAVAKAGGEKTLSVRTRHMIERITDIKKSDKKKARDAESSGFGHAERIRKVLGNLPTSRKVEAAGPLRVSLSDIEQSDKLGKWWLVGASWAGRDDPSADATKKATEEEASGSNGKDGKDGKGAAKPTSSKKKDSSDDDVLGSWGNDIADVEELDLLAREQGMNTDARRSIFVSLLSAADSKDAHARLLRLRLNKHERREIVNVLIRCVGSEQTYNRYYALVARQVCINDHRMSWVFQALLWKLFRRAGEQMFGEEPDSGDEADDNDDLNGNSVTGDDATSLRRIVNTAKLYGYLIASGAMSLDSLKCLTLIRLQTKIRMFVEVLLISLFEELQKTAKAGGSDTSTMIKKRFTISKERDDLRRGLMYFIDKVVRKSAIVEKAQQKSISRACDRAQKALRESEE